MFIGLSLGLDDHSELAKQFPYHYACVKMVSVTLLVILGYKMSQAVCRNRVSGADVDAQLCNASQQPEPQVVECNTHRCPAK